MATFHPSIADLIPVDLIPGDLPLEQTINSLLQKNYYEDLIISKNRDNTAGYYAMTLVLYTRLGIPLPAGLALVVNPSIDTNTNTEIPLELSYTWAVIKYISDFNPTSFGETPAEFFELFLNILDLSEEAFLTRLLDGFIGGSDPIQDVIDAVNNDASNGVTLTRNNTIVNREALIANLVQQITSSTLPAGTDFFSLFYGIYLAGSNSLDNIADFFSKWLGEIDFDEILQRLIPQFELLLPNVDVET